MPVVRTMNFTPPKIKVLFITFSFLLFWDALSGQALMEFDHPMIDNTVSFFSGSYDKAFIRKNIVESCLQHNTSFYFDSNGRLIKSIFISYDSITEVQLYRYDNRGDLVETEARNPKFPKPLITTSHKTYTDGRLTKDSSSSGYFCKHIEYYEDGSLKQELLFGLDSRSNTSHRLYRAFWFGIDSLGRINRIIDRDYMNSTDSAGQLLSNRTLLYNEKNQLIREDEAVSWKENNQKTLFCPNAGSSIFRYNDAGRLVEIIRTEGPSQKIKYLPNGLIAEIETNGRNCNGRTYHWRWTYTYTYRK
jgi:hypothetical protein